jgi:hypothetical protein
MRSEAAEAANAIFFAVSALSGVRSRADSVAKRVFGDKTTVAGGQ